MDGYVLLFVALNTVNDCQRNRRKEEKKKASLSCVEFRDIGYFFFFFESLLIMEKNFQ